MMDEYDLLGLIFTGLIAFMIMSAILEEHDRRKR